MRQLRDLRLHYLASGIFICSVVLLGLFGGLKVTAAGSANVYLRPATLTVTTGQTFTVEVRLDSGEQLMTAVEVYGTYDESAVEFIALDASGSPFNMAVEGTGGSGTFEIVRVAFDDAAGDALLARLTFKALRTGDTTLELLETSKLSDPDGVLFDLSRSNTVISVSANQPNETTTSNGLTPVNQSGTSQNQTSQSQGGLSMTVVPRYVGYTSASFVVETNLPSTVAINYGRSSENLEFTASSSQTEATFHVITLQDALLRPAEQYYFQSVSRTSAGADATGAIGNFTTQGIDVSVQVIDPDENPVSAIIESNGQSVSTNDNGYVVLTNLSDGPHEITVRTGWWKTSRHTITVDRSYIQNSLRSLQGYSSIEQTVELPTQIVQLDYQPIASTPRTIGMFVLACIVVLAVIVLGLRGYNFTRYRMHKARSIEHQEQPVIVQPSTPPNPENTPKLSDR